MVFLSYKVIREFFEFFNNFFRFFLFYRDRGIIYRYDEVFVDIEDVINVLLFGDGIILKKNLKVLVKFRVFFIGDFEC